MCWLVMADLSGRAARYFLGRERNRALAGYILEESLAGRSWTSLRARRTCTLGLLFGAMAKYGRTRGKWGGVVMGIPQTAIIAALRDPYETQPEYELPARPWRTDGKPELRDPARPARSTVFGEHRKNGRARSGQAGYFDAFVQCGAMKSYQLEAERAEPFEVLGPSGHALNRYDVVARELESVRNDDARYELLRVADVAIAASAAWERARSSRAAALGAGYEPPF